MVSSLLEVLIAVRSFPDSEADALMLPAGALRLLMTLPVHVAEEVRLDA